jgi:hypothetical protein
MRPRQHARTLPLAAALLAGVAGTPSSARGDHHGGLAHVCARAQPDSFDIDGRLDDWRGYRGTGVNRDSEDRAFILRCAYDDERLYLSVNVRDDRIVRTRKARAGAEDNLEITIGAPGGAPVRFRVFPGTRAADSRVVGAPRFVDAMDSLQEQGWSFEGSVELSRLDGWGRTTPALLADIAYHDADRAAAGRIDGTIRFRGRLDFSDARAVHRAFLRATGLDPRDVRLDALADVDPGDGAERIIAGKKIIGVLSDGYVYMELPVRGAEDVLDVRVVDLGGRSAILAHYRQYGNGGSRDLVSLWNLTGDGRFQSLVSFEVRKEMAGRRLENRWSLVPTTAAKQRGRAAAAAATGRRGYDIRVEVGEVVGWDAKSYREAPAPDAHPILLPWGQRRAVTYRFADGSLRDVDIEEAR